jgi:VWFA-related protein
MTFSDCVACFRILACLAVLLLPGLARGFAQGLPGEASSSLGGSNELLETMRLEVNVVNALVTVKDKHQRLVQNLPQDEFKVSENGKPQMVRYFAAETRQPLLLALLVDTSDSQRRFFQRQNEVASRFTKRLLGPQDEAMLVSFDARIDLVQERTHSAAGMLDALGRLMIGGSRPTLADDPDHSRHTVLYDAIVRVANRMVSIPGRKAMIVLTDGEDVGSQADIRKAVEAAQRADIVVYALMIADPHYYTARGYEKYHGGRQMMLLAKETGGGHIDIRGDEQRLDEAFDRIEQELRNQYSLGYVSSDQRRDGKFRSIKIESRRGHRVLTRRGYYAPAPQTSQVAAAGGKPQP